MLRFFLLLFTGLSVALAAPAAAEARLTAKPRAETPTSFPLGISPIGDRAFAYRPAPVQGELPGLLVLFHGAGGNARRFIELFRPHADRRQLVLLSIQSTDRTWDIVLRGARSTWNAGRASPIVEPGRDSRRVNAALSRLFGAIAVDPSRIAAVGFSDGASYALSLGLANDRLFSGVVALAPGFIAEQAGSSKQRVAITHGRDDPILPYANAQRIAQDLRSRGYPVRFISFDGGHEVSPPSLDEALDFALGADARPVL